MEDTILEKYETGNFSSIYVGSKPTVKLVMLRLENFILYYLRGPGGIDYSSNILTINSYAREIFYIEQTDVDKFENWTVYYDDENDCIAIRHCYWDKALDRNMIMADEKLRADVRDNGIVGAIPHINNETVIDVNKTSKSKLLNTIKGLDNVISEMTIENLCNNLDYHKGDYKISRSYDLDVRLETIINDEQVKIYSKIHDLTNLMSDILSRPMDTSSEYKISFDYQLSPIDVLKNTFAIKK